MEHEFTPKVEEGSGLAKEKPLEKPDPSYVFYPIIDSLSGAGAAVDRLKRGEIVAAVIGGLQNEVRIADFLAGAAYAMNADMRIDKGAFVVLVPFGANSRPSY